MAPTEIIIGASIAAVGTLAVVFHLVGRLDQARSARTRAARNAAVEVSDSLRIVEAIPVAYLPANLRAIVPGCLQAMIDALRRLSPQHADLAGHEARLQKLNANLAKADAGTTRPLLTPDQRKRTSTGLRDLKGLLQRAQKLAVITRQDLQRYSVTIDATLVRILVDHLKTNAFNSEAKGRWDDAVRYMQRAIDTLSTGNDGGRHTAEIATLRKEMARVQGLIRAAVEQRRTAANGPNELLRGLLNEAAREAAELKPAQYD